ncbi:EF-hand domain-containing protein [Salipiger sp. P9]|nr:EF-hand domain-containing protein [Salipiger pentaromativorans]
MTKLLMGAAIVVMGTAGLASAFPGGNAQRGDAQGRAPMMLEMFDQLDADGDGKVTKDELAAMGPAAAFAEADANGDGALEGDELTAFQAAQDKAREARRQQMMLQRFDADKDGKLSLEEMQANARGPAQMFDRLDTDKDGAVSKDELSALQQMRPMMGGDRKGQGERMGRDFGQRGPDGMQGQRFGKHGHGNMQGRDYAQRGPDGMRGGARDGACGQQPMWRR